MRKCNDGTAIMRANLTVEKRIYWQVFWRGYSVRSAALFHHKSVATRLHDFILNELQQLSAVDDRPLLDKFAYKRTTSYINQCLRDDKAAGRAVRQSKKPNQI